MAAAFDSSRRTLEHQSLHDNFTMLANRAAFMQRLRRVFIDADRTRDDRLHSLGAHRA